MDSNHRCSLRVLLYRQARSTTRPTIQIISTNKKPGDLAVQSGLAAALKLKRVYILSLSRIARAPRSDPYP